MIISLIITYMIASTSAIEDYCLNHNTNIEIENDYIAPILRQTLKINNWAVTTTEVQNSKCRESVPSLSELKNLNQQFYESDKQNAAIGGVNFENESEKLLEAFTSLITPNDFSIDEQKPINVSEMIPSDCKKVTCALDSIFGEELGQKLLYLKQFGFNSSELAHENASRLRIDEVDTLISSVRAFPPGLLPMTNNKQLTKFKRNYTLKAHDENTVAYAGIAFYDLWSEGEFTKEEMETTSYHEIAHYLSHELELDESPEWMSFSDWIDLGDNNYSSGKTDVFPSNYAKSSPAEDFAESVVAYRYNPHLLQTVSMDKYNFIKENLFAGVEYTTTESCQGKRIFPMISQTSLDAINSETQITPSSSNENLQSLLENCDDESYLLLMNRPESQDRFSSCIKAAASKRSINDETISNLIGEMATPPINPDFTERLLNRTINNIVDEVIVDDQIVANARQLLKEQISEAIYNNHNNPGFMAVTSFKSNIDACSSNWDTFSYQSLDIFSDDSEEYNLTSFSYRDELQEFTRNMCIDVGRRGGRMKRADVDEQLNHITNP